MLLQSSSSFPPGRDLVEKYLNKKDVRASIHASSCPLQYKECTDPPYNALKHQDGLGVTKEVSSLLDRGVRMLFFNGVCFQCIYYTCSGLNVCVSMCVY
jgi:carboxypeptidase D